MSWKMPNCENKLSFVGECRLNNSPHMIKISLSATLCSASAALSKRLQKPPRPLLLFWVSPIIRSQKGISKVPAGNSWRFVVCFASLYGGLTDCLESGPNGSKRCNCNFSRICNGQSFLTWKFLMSIATVRAVTACLPQKISSCRWWALVHRWNKLVPFWW